MGPIMEGLLRLQQIEGQLHQLQVQQNTRQRAVDNCRNNIEQIQAKIDQVKTQTQQLQMESDRLTVELKGSEQNVEKLRGQLNTAKTNKEYSALLTQINTICADSSAVEEKVLGLMGQMEQTDEEEKALQDQISEQEKQATSRVERLDTYLQQVNPQIMELRQKRTDITDALDPAALSMFERINAKHSGEAMALVRQESPKREEYVCDGCYMSLTIETVNALMTRDMVQTCGSCGRLLYLAEDAKAVTAKQ